MTKIKIKGVIRNFYMNTRTTTRSIRQTFKRLALWGVGIGALLMIPVIGNFPWTGSDFVFAGGVLFACAAAYELITRTMSNKIHRLVVGGVIGMIIMAIWTWAVA